MFDLCSYILTFRCNPRAVVAKIKKGLWRVIAKQDSMQKHNWVTAEDAQSVSSWRTRFHREKKKKERKREMKGGQGEVKRL